MLAAGLVLAAGGLAALVLLSPPAAPDADAEFPHSRITPPLARRILVIRLHGMPDGVDSWTELTPFFHDIANRGWGGRLGEDIDETEFLVEVERAGIAVFRPEPDDEPTGSGDISAMDTKRLEAAAAFDRYPSCVVWMSLNSAAVAAHRHGENLRTETGSASSTALAIRALDQRCFEAARRAGSGAVVLLIREFDLGRRADFAMAGPGIAVGGSPETPDRLQDTLLAVLGVGPTAMSGPSHLDGLEITDDERAAHERYQQQLRRAVSAVETAQWNALYDRLVRTAAMILTGMGLLLAIRAAWSMRARASTPS